MSTEILETADLRRITGYERAADIERSLTEQGIKVFRGKNGSLWTTLTLVNYAGGINSANDSDENYRPEDIIG